MFNNYKKNILIVIASFLLSINLVANDYSLFDYHDKDSADTWVGLSVGMDEIGKVHLGIEDVVGLIDLRIGAGGGIGVIDSEFSSYLLSADLNAIVELVESQFIDVYFGAV